MTDVSRSRLMILAAALLFSTGGAAIKACSMTAWQVAGLRSGVAAVALLLLIPSTRRHWTWRTLLVGLAYAATLLLYVQANKLTTATNAIFLQSTAPLYVLLVSVFFLREPVKPRELVFMAALALGLAVFLTGVEPSQATAPEPALGDLVGAVSGVTWGLTLAGLRWLARSEGREGGAREGAAAAATVVGNTLVLLVCLPFMFPFQETSAADWSWIGYLGVFQIAVAYVCLTLGMRHLYALEGALLLLLEPVLNPVWTWLLHGEKPGIRSVIGASIIFVATLVHTSTAGRGAARRP